MLILLELLLIALLIGNYYAAGRSVLSPAFLFTASFAFMGAWAIAFAARWELALSQAAFWTILGGTAAFSAVAPVVRRLFSGVKERTDLPVRDESTAWWKLLALLGLAVFTVVMTFLEMRRIMGTAGIVETVGAYRNAVAFDPHAKKVSGYLYYLGVVTGAEGLWIAHRVGAAIGCGRFPEPLALLTFLVCVVFGFLSGGRHDMICLVVVLAASAVFVKNDRKGRAHQPLTGALLLWTLLLSALGLILFAELTPLLGRSVTRRDYLDYLAVYCGAPLKNLDTALREGIPRSEVFGRYTFISLVNWLGTRFRLPIPAYSVVLPYRTVGEVGLGNVYTTFYAFWADFGPAGVLLMPALAAAASETAYALRRVFRRRTNLFTIAYGFMACALALSYFSNKFFETVFSVNFIKYGLVWAALNLFAFGPDPALIAWVKGRAKRRNGGQ